MAFSPFRSFRKHQKAMFAVLAVLSMFIFVLTGSMQAGWDFFNGITYYFGVSSKYPTIATMYGKRVDSVELQRLRYNRSLANAYMMAALGQVEMMSEFGMKSAMNQLMKDYPDIWQQIMRVAQSTRDPRQLSFVVDQILASPEIAKKPEGVALARQMMASMTQSQLLGERSQQVKLRRLYFGGSLDGEGLINFLIWKHQADLRGIHYDKDNIQTLINKDTLNLLTDADIKFVDGAVRNRFSKFKWADLQAALADEFAVRATKEALGYFEPGSEGLPDPTPFEFWKFYRENRATNRIALADIPARSPAFLAKIGKPTDQELQQLYEKYKEQQYTPQSPTPGFKQPPQIRVQWVRPQMDHFRAKAKLARQVVDAAMQVAAAGVAGAKPWDVVLPQAVDLRLLNEYEDAKNSRFRAPPLTSRNYALAYYPGLDQPENIAAAVGQACSGGLSGLLTYEAGAVARQTPEAKAVLEQEAQKRVQLGLGLVLSGFSGPLAPLAMYDEASRQPQYVPLNLVRSQLAAKLINQETLRLARDGMDQLQKQLEGLCRLKTAADAWHYLGNPRRLAGVVGMAATAGSPAASATATALAPGGLLDSVKEDGVARLAAEEVLACTNSPLAAMTALMARTELLPTSLAQAAVDRAVASGDFVSGDSQKLVDAYDVSTDPGLKPLKEVYRLEAITGDPTARRFSEQFFNDRAEPTEPVLYAPHQLAGGEDQYMFWNTAEKPAYVPSFAEARARVVSAWEMEKARPLAEAAAKELAAKAEKGGQPEQNLRDAAKRFDGSFFELSGIARLVPSQAPAIQSQMSFEERYAPYSVPDMDRDKLEYPTQTLVNKLLDLKKPGEVVVAGDEPEARFYVAALLVRTEPSVNSFYGDYGSPAKRVQLLQMMEADTHRVEDRRDQILERLHSEAKLEINKDQLEKLGPAPEDD